MRKLLILAVMITVLLTGCGANPGRVNGIEETANTTTEVAKTVETTTVISHVTTISTLTTAASKPTTQAHSVVVTRTEEKEMEIRTVPLNIQSKNDIGVLNFTEAKIDYEYGLLKLFFTLEATNKFEFDYDNISCKDKNGKSLLKVAYGGTIDQLSRESEGVVIVNDGSMFFGKVDDATDLSTVTVTYAFEGYDPVTVEFDIPGL